MTKKTKQPSATLSPQPAEQGADVVVTHDQLASAERTAAEYLDGWKRARAELANYRQQVGKQQQYLQAEVQKAAVVALLPLADNFQTMVQHVPGELKDNAWVTGVLHIATQLDQLLVDLGVTKVGVVGEQFNPQLHEAIAEEASQAVLAGIITEVVQPGYVVGEITLRPAKVKIAK